MIATALIIGAGLIIGVGLIAVFWNKILDYLKKAINKIQGLLQRSVVGIRVFLRKTSDGVLKISKFHFKDKVDSKKWDVRVATSPMEETDIPNDIKDRLMMDEEFEITDELENQIRR